MASKKLFLHFFLSMELGYEVEFKEREYHVFYCVERYA